MKYLLLNACLFFAINSFAQVNLTNGLVAYYPFNGNAKDESGNKNDPVYNNATLTNDRFGRPNAAYYFNGKNNYMKVRNRPSINFGNKMSIALWVRPTGFYTGTCYNNMLLMKGDNDYLAGNYSLRFSDVYTGCTSPTTTKERFYDGNGAVAQKPLVKLNNWYFVVSTYDGTTTKIYVNCELQHSFVTDISSFRNNFDLYFGHLNNEQYPYWLNGDLDDVRLYNRALSEAEILSLCDAKPTADEKAIPEGDFEFSLQKCNEVNFNIANKKNIKAVKWRLGDNTTNTKENFTHVYKKDGNYEVTLTITGKDGEAIKITKEIVIIKPVASFSFKASSNPLKIQFKNSSKEKIMYKWDFGDGENLKSSFPKAFTHTYAAPGNYTVQLIAENKTGCTNTFAQQIIIEKPAVAEVTDANIFNKPKTVTTDNLPTLNILPEKRINNLVRQIEVVHDSIQISFYDNGDIDGDSITVSYNNKIITEHLLLTANGKAFTIKVEPAPYENELVMYAENLGSIPPNTALMIVYDGTKRHEINISSSNTSNGKVSFIHKR